MTYCWTLYPELMFLFTWVTVFCGKLCSRCSNWNEQVICTFYNEQATQWTIAWSNKQLFQLLLIKCLTKRSIAKVHTLKIKLNFSTLCLATSWTRCWHTSKLRTWTVLLLLPIYANLTEHCSVEGVAGLRGQAWRPVLIFTI